MSNRFELKVKLRRSEAEGKKICAMFYYPEGGGPLDVQRLIEEVTGEGTSVLNSDARWVLVDCESADQLSKALRKLGEGMKVRTYGGGEAFMRDSNTYTFDRPLMTITDEARGMIAQMGPKP